MAGREKNCKWTFGEIEGNIELLGVNETLTQQFKTTPVQALVRESIQNSLDAVSNSKEPVLVDFQTGEFEINSFPKMFDLKLHVKAILNTFKEKAEPVYAPMLPVLQGNSINYICVSDYNTKGMLYDETDKFNCPFTSFVRSSGNSAGKEKGSGGSFGFGKGAYFGISQIRTLLTFTVTDSHRCFFEGASRLCSHEMNGVIHSNLGFYDNSDGFSPISDAGEIPVPLRRNRIENETKASPELWKSGTDIFILAPKYESEEDFVNEAIYAVLRNFWCSIHDKRLIVKIADKTITAGNLNDYMLEYFSEVEDNHQVRYSNPRPYYEAVVNAQVDDKHHKFSAELPILGKCSFYMLEVEKARGRYCCMRGPRMRILMRRPERTLNFYGVFICESLEGNDILKGLENPQHDDWNYEYWRDNANKPPRVLEELSEFIEECINEIYKPSEDGDSEIIGLDDILYNSEEFDDDLTRKDPEPENPFFGTESDNTTEDGPAVDSVIENNEPQTSTAPDPNREKGRIVEMKAEGATSEGEDDIETGHKGGSKKESPGDRRQPGDQKEKGSKDPSDEEVHGRFYLPVKYRVIAQCVNGVWQHDLIIRTDKAVAYAEIELMAGGEDGQELIVPSATNNGKIENGIITKAHLEEGRNIITITFSDNFKHALYLEAYEVK